ncbi:MAG TPA: ATP-dependent DNA helicase RecQ [Sphingobacteriaceae bacterium]|nr:ATP-dependent DNA helicase RecQ [Sphingobacteriaceae bacterium]
MSIYSVLKQYWGYSAFRPPQEDIIRSVLEGNDTLALMPTGGGKSVCFQVPALLNPGICIVISPLIALMKDQVENLKSRGISAIAIISGMGKREIDILLDNCIYGEIKFLYLSPERLLSDLVRERIRYMNVNLIAVDEAHCISQWGYDFRPPYLHVADIRELHPNVPVLALTATATDKVAIDIQEKLKFKKNNIFTKSFERKNLSYVVFDEENKIRKLLTVIKKVKGTGIVYVRNRRETQEVARLLIRENISADFYHAGLDTPLRMKKQHAWKTGAIRIIVATNAFGMGIDKPDVRLVIHMDLPESLEAYYQEAGRAGRDEKKAYAVLLYNQADILFIKKKLEQSYPSVEEIKQVYHYLGNYYQLAYGAGEGLSLPFDVAEFCSRFKLNAIKTLNALKFLERDEYVALSETVFLPSRVKMLIDNEDIYRFQVEHQQYDAFIKTILRSYGGIFDHFIPVKEFDLAKRLAISREDVEQILNKLQDLELLSYLKQTDKPQLQFLKARENTSHVVINGSYLRERYAIQKIQVNSVISYATQSICRNSQILKYFNQPATGECGVCDVCLEKKRENLKETIVWQITNDLVAVLNGTPLSLDALVNKLPNGSEKEKIEVIRELLDAGKIKTDGAVYYI